MTNADKFKNIFGLYATELWSMPEKDFLKWLNSEAMNCSEFPNNSDMISRQAAIDALYHVDEYNGRSVEAIRNLPSAEPKRGEWILDRSGTYCCSECMEPCATYVMMKPRDKFCKMCGAKMEVTE